MQGPEMKSIKASPQEYDELGFNPKARRVIQRRFQSAGDIVRGRGI